MGYSDLLKDPRWQKLRLKIFDRDGWKCRVCECEAKTLHVHHKKYVWGANPWDSPPEDLITVCENCHSEYREGIRAAENHMLVSLRKAGYWPQDIVLIADALAGFKDKRWLIPNLLNYFSRNEQSLMQQWRKIVNSKWWKKIARERQS